MKKSLGGVRNPALIFRASDIEKIHDHNEQCILVIHNMFLKNTPTSIVVWPIIYLQYLLKDNSAFETENLGVPRDKITSFNHIYGTEHGHLAFVCS